MTSVPLAVRLRRQLADVWSTRTILGGPATTSVRSMAYLDGRRAVRLAFLSGAAASGYLAHLPATASELAEACGATRVDRLKAWLRVGVELGELAESAGRFTVTGRRAKAVAANDPIVEPFYRSIAEYYFGPHQDLADLVSGSAGRDDLSRSAGTIADVSRVTEPILAGTIAEVVDTVLPNTWLEIGCGSGVHLIAAMQSRSTLRAVAVDLDADVVETAANGFAHAGVGDRVDTRVGDALKVVASTERFDVITLLNNIYYFTEGDRPALIEQLLSRLNPGGELVVSSQCAADTGARSSVAAAQLDFLLRNQREASASLPTPDQLSALFDGASQPIHTNVRRPVPGEPFYVVRARKLA